MKILDDIDTKTKSAKATCFNTVHFITLSKNKGTQYDWQKGKISYL